MHAMRYGLQAVANLVQFSILMKIVKPKSITIREVSSKSNSRRVLEKPNNSLEFLKMN